MPPLHTDSLLPVDWPQHSLGQLAQLAPIQPLSWPLAEAYGIRVCVKREDLLCPHLGGNKLYKLYHHLQAAQALKLNQFITCGGAYSNHLYAFAYALAQQGKQGVAIVRGDAHVPPSPTLRDIQALGCKVVFVNREAYRQRHLPAFWQGWQNQFGPSYVIGEGGGGVLGALGVLDYARALAPVFSHSLNPHTQPAGFDVLALAVGTGATLAGVVAAGVAPKVYAVCSLKLGQGQDTYGKAIHTLVASLQQHQGLQTPASPWQLDTHSHAGGYGRMSTELRHFMHTFEAATGVPLDPVYTAKVFWGLSKMLPTWPVGTRVLVLHTGGLQGRRGLAFFNGK